MRLFLAGVQSRIPRVRLTDDESLDFFGRFFKRAREVWDGGDVMRYVGYTWKIDEAEDLVFIGLETGETDLLPDDMTAWVLTDTSWEIRSAGAGGKGVIARRGIGWNWIDSPPGDERRGTTGEFYVRGAESFIRGERRGRCRLSANAYIRLDREYEGGDRVALASYNPAWPSEYAGFSRHIRDMLGPEIALRIEHIGSTAVPGIPAKPIIDVLVEIPSFAEARKRVIPLLNTDTWEYWGYDDHPVFIKRDGFMGRRTHHLHLATRGHREWETVLFRDYLLAHPQVAGEYARLKEQLALTYSENRELYTIAKRGFIRDVTSLAREEARQGGT